MLDTDMETADCVLWVGLSFEQSATTSYFRRVRSALSAVGRFAGVPQFLVNPSDEALWNLLSSCSNQGEVEVAAIIASSDDVLPKVRIASVRTRVCFSTTSYARALAQVGRVAAATAVQHTLHLKTEEPGVVKPDTPQLDAAPPLEDEGRLQARDPPDAGPFSPTNFNTTVFGHVPRRSRN